MILLASLVPIVILFDVHEYGVSIFAIAPIWLIYSSQIVEGAVTLSGSFSTQFNPFLIFNQLPTVVVRFLYVYWIYQFYLDKTTMKRALVIGIIAEIQGPVFVYIMLGAPVAIVPFVPLTFPLVLIAGYLLMIRKTPTIHVEWLEKTESV